MKISKKAILGGVVAVTAIAITLVIRHEPSSFDTQRWKKVQQQAKEKNLALSWGEYLEENPAQSPGLQNDFPEITDLFDLDKSDQRPLDIDNIPGLKQLPQLEVTMN